MRFRSPFVSINPPPHLSVPLDQNFYFTKIASDVIILQEIMTALLAADEKDKKDISLIGRAKTGAPRESNDTGTQLE